MKRRAQSGVTLVATGIWILALAAIAAISVEVARITTTATEVQTAADSAAIGGALALVQGNPGQANARGTAAAGANFADGRSVNPSGVQIELGHYATDPATNPHFTTTCSGNTCNAVKATVTVDNVQFIMASIFGTGQTSVQKIAVAGGQCQGGASALPLAICRQTLANPIDRDDLCVDGQLRSNLSMQSGSNACWTYLSSPTHGTSTVQELFPKACGGITGTTTDPRYVTVGQTIDFVGNPGVSNATWNNLQCCIACQNLTRYTVPVIDCPGTGNPCQGTKQVVGFATIDITAISDGSSSRGNCGNSLSPWGSCGARPDNSWSDGVQQIAGNQICRANLPGTPGGPSCTNFGNTVAPVMGQLP